jgi:hypothetical protein
MIDGKQYVGIAAGMEGAILQIKRGPAAVVIYCLPLQTGKQ